MKEINEAMGKTLMRAKKLQMATHTEVEKIANDPEWVEWLNGRPKYVADFYYNQIRYFPHGVVVHGELFNIFGVIETKKSEVTQDWKDLKLRIAPPGVDYEVGLKSDKIICAHHFEFKEDDSVVFAVQDKMNVICIAYPSEQD